MLPRVQPKQEALSVPAATHPPPSLDFVYPHPDPKPEEIASNPRNGVYLLRKQILRKRKVILEEDRGSPLHRVVTSDLESGPEPDDDEDREEEEEEERVATVEYYYVAQRDCALFRYAISYEVVAQERQEMLNVVENVEHSPRWLTQQAIQHNLGDCRWWEISTEVVTAFSLAEAHLLAKGMSLSGLRVGWFQLPPWCRQVLQDQDMDRPDMFLMEQSAIGSMLLCKRLCEGLDPKCLGDGAQQMLSHIVRNINQYERHLASRISAIPMEMKNAPTTTLPPPPSPTTYVGATATTTMTLIPQ